MAKKVQGIIIKDNKVLMVQGISESGRRDNFFISGEIKETENEVEAIKRELKEQLNIDCDVSLKFTKEFIHDIKTLFIDLDDKNVSLDYNIEDVKCYNQSFKPIDLKWVDISDVRSFREFDIQYIRQLLEEAIKNDYEGKWIKTIDETYFSSQIGVAHLKNLYRERERKKVDSKETMKNKIVGLLMALGLGILFNYFFIWDYIGISGFIFAMAIIFASSYGVYKNIKLNKRLGLVFLIPIILLSITFSIYNDPVLTALNVMLIPFLIASYLITIRYESITEINLSFIWNLLDRVFVKALGTSPKLFIFGKEIIGNRTRIKQSSTRKNIIRGLLISIPLLVVILVLLSSADMMFKYYIQNIGNIFGDLSIVNIFDDTIIIAIVTIYMFGFLWSFKYNHISYENRNTRLIKPLWEPITIITVIFMINIAYLLFTIVQFSYLYGGGINSLPQGFSYAEYARRGFFELILVTLINFGILILSMNLTKKDNIKLSKIANISYSLLILFTFNMLVSASYKMYLYEKAFGFTRLRIFVQAFMILIGILLLISLLGIWIKRIPIFKYAVIATLVVYVGLNYVNVDRLIAKENIIRYEETKNIDIRYITRLSHDAAPEIVKLLEVDDVGIRNSIKAHLEYQRETLRTHYNRWHEFNYYKNNLLEYLN